MIDFIKSLFGIQAKYEPHPEAVIISCFFNPQNSFYRLKAFRQFYESIQHTNHFILECVIGKANSQLPDNKFIKKVYTENLLWHKESLLNKIVADYLDRDYKYIFWVDADVLFTNQNWIVEGVEELERNNIVQPFEYCIHLEKNETKPSFNVEEHRKKIYDINYTNRRLWRSFSANYKTANLSFAQNENYNIHGHVGFAWGARREILTKTPLYDRALIGGADHIIAHAATGQIPHSCITKSFTDNLEEVLTWSKKFYQQTKGKVGFVKGDLYHLWHGDIDKRQYLKRIQDFTTKTKQIIHKDENGLYVTHSGDDEYMKKYFKHREVTSTNDDYFSSMGISYMDSSSDDTVEDAIVANTFLENDKDITGSGGEFGGAGSTGSWDDSSSSHTAQSDNFS